MKKLFVTLAVSAAMFALVSCEKESTTAGGSTPANGSEISISFISPKTRAFGNGTTETWEKAVNSAVLMVFNASGNIVLRRDLSTAEITSAGTTPISLIVPGVEVGDNCDFVVVVNRAVSTTIVSKDLIYTEVENDGVDYNGTFADITTKSLRSGGFVMTGETSQAIVAGTTSVTIPIKRTVSKVEVACATTPEFTAKYGDATITFNKVTLLQSATKSLLMDQSTSKYAEGGNTSSYEQPSSAGKNLFYIYEQAAAATGARVKVSIDATYDADGLTATTGDRVSLAYETELLGATGGQILRNGAYLLNAKIDGLTGADIKMSVTISDWETLNTQDSNLGN